MRGTLYYSADGLADWERVGTSKTKGDQELRIESIIARNRINNPEVIGQRVYIKAKYLALHEDFLDEIEWYFRFILSDSSEITINQRKYILDTDYTPERNDITFYTVTIEYEKDV
jgi:hypothetical protein